jgi:flagellar motility protein MotE (MotC chaperone)
MMSGSGRMVELAPRNSQARNLIGVQPIAIGVVALVLVLFGIGSIALWRAFTGNAPETDRMVAARQLQARTAQVSEALVEKTKGIEETQQESIDQLQVVQDQLQTMRKQFAAQQADAKKLSDQVAALTEQVEGLRQSLASAQANEPSAEPAPRTRSKATRSANRKRHGSRG